MNLKNKIIYIIRFITKNDNGKFRSSYIFPLLSSILGSYIIFMIFSIMNGMGSELEDRVGSFHYKYYYNKSTFPDDFKFSGSRRIAILKADLASNSLCCAK